ncbi:MAG: hypothetical protein KAG66_11990, partial [Methylococcales bacterium]|nr:hypothetical protein [Methylococcales bacterium]
PRPGKRLILYKSRLTSLTLRFDRFGLEPMFVHPNQKLRRQLMTEAPRKNRVDLTFRAQRSLLILFVVEIRPLADLMRGENLKTVKTTS